MNPSPTFGGMTSDVQDRWYRIRRFVEKWGSVEIPVTNCLLPTVPTNDFSQEYPLSLIEWFRFSSAAPQFEFLIRGTPVTNVLSEHSAFAFLNELECDGGNTWGIRFADFLFRDPPVYSYWRDVDDEPRGPYHFRGIACATLTEFVFSSLLQNVLPHLRYYHDVVSDNLIDRMKAEFESCASFGGYTIFESDEIIAVTSITNTLTLGTLNSQCPDVPTSLQGIISDVNIGNSLSEE